MKTMSNFGNDTGLRLYFRHLLDGFQMVINEMETELDLLRRATRYLEERALQQNGGLWRNMAFGCGSGLAFTICGPSPLIGGPQMADTVVANVPQFYRRVNPDGTVDAICLICYLTAATAESEAELHQQQSAHRCHDQRAGQSRVR